MPRTYKGGVSAVQQDMPVDPLRPARLDRLQGKQERSYYPSPTATARGILGSPEVLAELFRLMAWLGSPEMDALCEAWQEAKAGRGERLERYRTRPVSEWGQ